MTIGKSSEDYLEAILVLQQEKGMVRSIDVAHHMEYSKPSISRAMSHLKSEGLIEMQPDGELLLTKEGRKIAEDIYERHTILTNLLVSLGVQKQTAADDACLVEHVISEETFQKVKDAYRKNFAAGHGGESMPEQKSARPAVEEDTREKEKKKKKKKKKS